MRARRIHLPDGAQLIRFWIAPLLTCALFMPAMGAGIFGAPTMILSTAIAWWLLRRGSDDYGSFCMAGFIAAIWTLFAMALIAPDFAALYLFGLIFGPLMAMTFRAISGTWRAV